MLTYPYRTPPPVLIGVFAFFAALLAVFGYLLLDESPVPRGFVTIARVVAALSALFVLVTPYVLLQSRGNMLHVTDRELTVDTPFGSTRRITLAGVDDVKVHGTGRQRGMTISGAGTRIPINQMMLPDAAAFDAVLREVQAHRC